MTRMLILSLAILATLAGCSRVGSSRLNPFTWFSGSRAATPLTTPVAAADPRPLMDQVSALALDRTPGGAIIRARGLAPRQGYYAADLLPVPAGAGLLAYEFRVAPPPEPTRISTPRSREIDVAVFVSDADLATIREIRVSAARNARALGR